MINSPAVTPIAAGLLLLMYTIEMAVIGSTTKITKPKAAPKVKKVTPKTTKATKAKIVLPEFKQYMPRAQASASERLVQNPKGGSKKMMQLYRPNKTGSLSPNKITKLKQIRANEASQARDEGWRNPSGTRSKSNKVLVKPNKAAKQMKQAKSNPTSFVSTGERAPKTTFGVYRKVTAAPADTKGTKDYRKDYNSTAAIEGRNKSINDMRQRQVRKDSYRKQVSGIKRKKK
jgi:hypothetical protein